MLRIVPCVCVAAVLALLAVPVNGQLVRYDTVFGKFDIELYNNTPISNANFLAYVDAGDYTSSIVHRSPPNFVVQGGGFRVNSGFTPIATRGQIQNEPFNSNVRGTVSYAKSAGFPNSATSQWFINVVDNSASLDVLDGGFSAFAEVKGDGMDVVDTISGLQIIELTIRNFFSDGDDLVLENVPVRNYVPPTVNFNNLVLIHGITQVQNTLGDLNGSGAIDANDVDLLFAAYGPTPANDIELDLDSSGDVGLSDLIRMIERIAGTRVGDLNFDGDVDISSFNPSTGQTGDASAFLANLGTTSGATYAQGDLNGDGDVDISDFDPSTGLNTGDAVILLANLGFNNSSGAAPAASAVPEPGLAPALFAVLISCAGRRRRLACI